jgi:cytochrome c peroxidase
LVLPIAGPRPTVIANVRLLIVMTVIGCSAAPTTTKDQLGKLLFMDTSLSQPPGQSCADCHAPRAAFRDPESDHSTSMGAVTGRFGARNAPTTMYARFVPPLHLDAATQRWIGGLFWDGRADTLEAQAAMPMLNRLEMNDADQAAVVDAVRRASYAPAFRALCGDGDGDGDGDGGRDVQAAFGCVLDAIAAYERTAELAPFSSKYDRYLAGTATLSDAEQRGLAIFEDPARGNCASCHPSRPSADGAPPLFTDFSYANIGIPRYANSLFYRQPHELNPDGDRAIDHGLATTTGDPAQDGKFRVPTLRNVARTKPYGHNGYFDNVPAIVDFLSSRDLGSSEVGDCARHRRGGPTLCAWPPPEVPATIDPRVGHLGLGAGELADLVAFLATLSDEPR